MSYYRTDGSGAVDQIPLAVGDRVKFAGDHRWWTVKAVSEHFTAFTRQAEFERRGVLCYTVADWRNGVRGPCDLVGQGYGDGSYSEAECMEMLARFELPDDQPEDTYEMPLYVSQRNWVPIEFTEVPAAAAK